MPNYMLLIYAPTEGGPPPEQLADQMQRWSDYTRSLQEAGVLAGAEQLHGVEAATTVRVRDGETQITDGPFAETKEFLGGYYVLDCQDLDTALEHAARAPIVQYGSVEVRPIVDRSAERAPAEPAQAQA